MKKIKLKWWKMLNGWFPICPKCDKTMAKGDYFLCTYCGYAVRAGACNDEPKA